MPTIYHEPGKWVCSGRIRWQWKPVLVGEGYEGEIWRRAGSISIFEYNWPPLSGGGTLEIVSRSKIGSVMARWDETFGGFHWSGDARLTWIDATDRTVFFGRWWGAETGKRGTTDSGTWAAEIPKP